MRDKEWHIAIFGTFDVENYGDLLFPLIAEAELAKRLGSVTLHRFSYHAKSPPDWPYEVTSLTELPTLAHILDGVIIGGGFLIRFDKVVAPNYGPSTPDIHHPTGYWLTPALIALQHDIPLIWNAPGMHCNNIPAWSESLMKLALENSRYIRVRDKPSQEALSRFIEISRIGVLPDTAFGITRLLNNRNPSAEINHLRELSDLSEPYIIVQAIHTVSPFLRLLKNQDQLFRDFRFLVLPIGPVLGDHASIISDDLPGSITLPFWPHPLLLAELISRSAAVIGHSYHLAITALAFGVPVFSSADFSTGKYTALSDFEGIFSLPKETGIDPNWFISRIGKKSPPSGMGKILDQLNDHWNHIATIIREEAGKTHPSVNRFWQSLPNHLEAASIHSEAQEATRIANQQRIDELSDRLARAHTIIEAASARSEAQEATRIANQQRIDELSDCLAQAHTMIEAASALSEAQEATRIANQQRIDELSDRLANARTMIEAASAHSEAQEATRIANQQRIDELSDRLANAHTMIEAASAHCQAMEATQIANRQYIDELRELLSQAHIQIEALYNSRSMKITTPLRLLMRSLNRLIGK